MKHDTKVEIAIGGLALLAVMWLWLANTAKTGSATSDGLPFLGGGDAGGAGALSALPPAVGGQTFAPGDTTFNLGDIYLGGMASTPANPAAGVGTCGCGCNDGSPGSEQQFGSVPDLAAFLSSLPIYQDQQAVAQRMPTGGNPLHPVVWASITSVPTGGPEIPSWE